MPPYRILSIFFYIKIQHNKLICAALLKKISIMNIIYTISIYMLASSVIMISYVWFRYIKHRHSTSYNETAESDDYAEENYYNQEILAA